MSTVMCPQSLQSCLEPMTLGVKAMTCNQTHILPPLLWGKKLLAPSDSDSIIENLNKKCISDDDGTDNNNKENDLGGWSFLVSPTKEVVDDKEGSYVHPLVKRSTSTLSEKSLELCTENLGCETGTNIMDITDFSSSYDSDSNSARSSPTRERSTVQHSPIHEKVNHRSYPPPLFSITSSDCIQYRPHREGGRLVIKAISVASSTMCFQAERGNGRLRLLFQRNYDDCFEAEHEEQEYDSGNDDDDDNDDENEDEKYEEDNAHLNDELDENQEKYKGELGLGHFQRASGWCKESGGHKTLSNWDEHFWVTT